MPAALLAAVPALVSFLVLGYLAYRATWNNLTRAFFFFVLSLAVWQTSDALVRLSATGETAKFWANALGLGALLITPVGFQFALLFTEGQRLARRAGVVALLYGPVVLFETLIRAGFNDVDYAFQQPWGWVPQNGATLTNQLEGIWVAGLALAILVVLVRYAVDLPRGDPKRSQTILVAAGFSIPTLQGTVTQVILPTFFGVPAWPVASTAMLAFSVLTLVALRRYQFLSLPTVEEELADTQKELARKATQLENAQRVARVGSWEWDLAAQRITWSEEMFRLYGYGEERFALTFDKAMERVVPDDQARIRADMARLLRDYRPPETRAPSVTYRVRLPSGDERALHSESTLSGGTAGHPQSLVGTVQDVTQLRQVEDELRASQQQFSDLFHASPAALCMCRSDDGRIVNANDSFLRLMDVSAANAVGRPVALLGALDPVAFHQAAWRPMATQRALKNTEVHWRGPEGVDRLLLVSGAVLENAGQTHFLLAFNDITDQRKGELQAQEIVHLQELNNMRTRLLSTAAHELRTPLTPIRIELEVLRRELEGKLDGRAGRELEILERNFERLTHLVDDLLDAARLQAGQMGLQPQRLDLTRLASEATEAFASDAARRHLTLETAIVPTLKARGDPRRISQVLYNLLSNAMKFTPAGGAVHVEAREVQEGFLVRVRDTGVGLRADAIPRLFAAFSQVHEPGSSRESGTGLGLYICKAIVELHGGRIWVESPGLGKGTTVSLLLPREAAPSPPSTGAGPIERASRGPVVVAEH